MMIERVKLTPPQIARLWGTGVEKVYAAIRSGQLRAINLSSGHERPRFLIDKADLAAFEASRVVVPAVTSTPRTRKPDVPSYV
jgi:hypothetical protein